jgi:hypothetical protein
MVLTIEKKRRIILVGKICSLFFVTGILLLIISSQLILTKQVSVINPLCNESGSYLSQRFFTTKMVLRDVVNNKIFSLRFPIGDYEGSYTDIYDTDGKIIDRWYAGNFCVYDQDSLEAYSGIYDGGSPIVVKYNLLGRIKAWQLLQ